MTRRQQAWLIVVAILVMLNVWRWWPAPEGRGSATQRAVPPASQSLRVEDFVIQAAPVAPLPPARRNLFQEKAPVVVRAPVRVAPPVPPPKSAAELAREQALTEYAQLRCLGVAFRNGKGMALVSHGQQHHHVGVGDRLAGRFVVRQVTAEGVVIEDAETGVGGTLAIQPGGMTEAR